MISILVVDDDITKINSVVAEIENGSENKDLSIKTASYSSDVFNILKNENIDIMILDICFPDRPGSMPEKDAGIKLLKKLKDSSKYAYPKYVIALSQYEDLTSLFSEEIGLIHSSILYDVKTNEWKIRMVQSINTAITILLNQNVIRNYDYDIAIICALKEELDLFKRICSKCRQYSVQGDDNGYYVGEIDNGNRKIKTVMTYCTQMGMVSAATLATKMIYNFVPRYIVMTGIAAGIRGKCNFGDIVAAEYAWDYGAGKEALDCGVPIHKNTIQQIPIDTDMAGMVRQLAEDHAALSNIKHSFDGKKPDAELKLMLGPVASGASVISNPEYIGKIQEQIRDVLAIEMEIYGIYYAARWAIDPKPSFLAIKSICDYADEDKNDDYHNYASYTSAKVLEKLARDYFEYE